MHILDKKMNELDLYYIKCLKITNNATNIKLKRGTYRISRHYYNCVYCGFKKLRVKINYYIKT